MRVELRRDAETTGRLGVGRTPQHHPVRAQHDRQLAGEDAEALDHGTPVGIIRGVEHGAGIAVAGEEALQAGKIGRAGFADQHRADPALFQQSDPPENERAHQDLADLGRTDHQGAYMRRVERKRGAALRSGAARGKRLAPGKLADLARELAGMVGGDRRLAVETIAADDIDRTLEHEPGRRIGYARVEYRLAGREIPGRPAGEALGRFDLAGVQHRKHLVAAGLNYAHRYSLSRAAGGTLACKASEPDGPRV